MAKAVQTKEQLKAFGARLKELRIEHGFDTPRDLVKHIIAQSPDIVHNSLTFTQRKLEAWEAGSNAVPFYMLPYFFNAFNMTDDAARHELVCARFGVDYIPKSFTRALPTLLMDKSDADKTGNVMASHHYVREGMAHWINSLFTDNAVGLLAQTEAGTLAISKWQSGETLPNEENLLKIFEIDRELNGAVENCPCSG